MSCLAKLGFTRFFLGKMGVHGESWCFARGMCVFMCVASCNYVFYEDWRALTRDKLPCTRSCLAKLGFTRFFLGKMGVHGVSWCFARGMCVRSEEHTSELQSH